MLKHAGENDVPLAVGHPHQKHLVPHLQFPVQDDVPILHRKRFPVFPAHDIRPLEGRVRPRGEKGLVRLVLAGEVLPHRAAVGVGQGPGGDVVGVGQHRDFLFYHALRQQQDALPQGGHGRVDGDLQGINPGHRPHHIVRGLARRRVLLADLLYRS